MFKYNSQVVDSLIPRLQFPLNKKATWYIGFKFLVLMSLA